MLLHNLLKNYRVVLASQSPRRQKLLSELGIQFEVRLNGDNDESYPDSLERKVIPEYLAKKKALPFLQNLASNEVLITSDTIVIQDNTVIGKPKSYDDAIAILNKLSGQKHTVISGVAISSIQKQITFSATTDVYFRELAAHEISYYINTFKPYDKAGAYGIQEWIGYVGVERIDGSYFNVMGLPVQKLYTELLYFLEKINNP